MAMEGDGDKYWRGGGRVGEEGGESSEISDYSVEPGDTIS